MSKNYLEFFPDGQSQNTSMTPKNLEKFTLVVGVYYFQEKTYLKF